MNNADIYTFAQLAALSQGDLALELHGLGISNARLQDWIENARQLAAEESAELTRRAEERIDIFPGLIDEAEIVQVTTADSVEDKLASGNIYPQNRMQYINFMVELWLGEDNGVLRTRVTHLQDHSQTAWSGWEGQKLIDFIVEHTRLFQPVQTTNAAQPQADLAAVQIPLVKGTGSHAQLQAPAGADTELLLKEMIVTRLNDSKPTHILIDHQPFLIHLVLDMSKVDRPPGTILGYSAEVFAKDLSRGTHRVVGEDQGQLLITEQASIEVVGRPLQHGPYRFEAVVKLAQHSGDASPSWLMAFLDGGGFQVY